jgi:hypothetical protein
VDDMIPKSDSWTWRKLRSGENSEGQILDLEVVACRDFKPRTKFGVVCFNHNAKLPHQSQ